MQSNKDKIKPAHRETKLDSCKLITDFYNGHLVITDILVSPEKSEREREQFQFLLGTMKPKLANHIGHG